MDNWDATVVYQVAMQQHDERVTRGEAAQRLAAAIGGGAVRTRLATGLIALASRLDPAIALARRVDDSRAILAHA